MTLAAGTRLGPYEIVAPIGAGGMGEVYRARDTRLGRDVALKVLLARYAASAQMRERFEQEAQTISRFAHPGICTIFDVGSHEGTSYLVMELLLGESLAERISKGPFLLPQALRIAREVCLALDAAHRQGIVHRDVKPANIFLAGAGTKLLDFGLAKLRERIEAGELSQMATLKSPLTEAGAVLGTLGYMAPEQLEGKPADARSDIFSLGAVLFEMVTGKRAFPGESSRAVITAILSIEPPPISSVRALSPPALDRVVRTCLAKDPEERWQNASDLARELAWIEGQGAGVRVDAAPAGATSPRARRSAARWIPWIAAAGATAVALAALLRPRDTPVRPAQVVRFTLPPPSGGAFFSTVETTTLAVSPDGRRIAFVVADAPRAMGSTAEAADLGGERRIWVRSLGDTEARAVAGTDGATSLFFSPDGRSLGFFTPGKLRRVDLDGGTPVPICDVPVGAGRSGTWGAGGDILFTNVQGVSISRVSSAGGSPVPVVRADASRGEIRLNWPWFLPDGKRFLYYVRLRDKSARIMFAEPGAGPRALLSVASSAQFLEPGFLVFAREGALLAQAFDWRSGSLSSDPFSIAETVNYFETSGHASFAVSPVGTLAYQFSANANRLVRVDRSGREVGTFVPSGNLINLSMSEDGRRVYFDRTQAGIGTWDVWSLDLERGIETRITSSPDTELAALELADRRSIVLSASRQAQPQLYRVDLASGREEQLAPAPGAFQIGQDISPDGRTLVYIERTPDSPFDIWSLPLAAGGKPTLLLRSSFGKRDVRFAPDGNALSFISDESGRPEAYVMPYPGPGERRRVSTSGARLLRWSHDGRELLYVSLDQRLLSVPVQASPSLFTGTPRELFVLAGKPWSSFVVSRDGKSFVAIVPEMIAGEQPLAVIANWVPGGGR